MVNFVKFLPLIPFGKLHLTLCTLSTSSFQQPATQVRLHRHGQHIQFPILLPLLIHPLNVYIRLLSVVNQRYDPEVQSLGGFLGNNVLMRCNVPSFVRDHVTVTSWLQEPAFNIYPSTMSGTPLILPYIFFFNLL